MLVSIQRNYWHNWGYIYIYIKVSIVLIYTITVHTADNSVLEKVSVKQYTLNMSGKVYEGSFVLELVPKKASSPTQRDLP